MQVELLVTVSIELERGVQEKAMRENVTLYRILPDVGGFPKIHTMVATKVTDAFITFPKRCEFTDFKLRAAIIALGYTFFESEIAAWRDYVRTKELIKINAERQIEQATRCIEVAQMVMDHLPKEA